jgi:hypothetical protein
LKLGGCLAIHLRLLLNQSSPPLDQNLAHFKIQMNFGRIHQISLFSFLSSSFLLPLDQGGILAGYTLSPSLILLALSTWTQRKGGDRGKSCKDCTPLSPTHLHHPKTPTSIKPPSRRVPRPHLQVTPLPYLTTSLSQSPRPPRACSCRPRRRGQASPCHHTTSRPQSPSSLPNRLLPPTPPVGHPLARVLSLPVHALDAESGIAVPKHAAPSSPRTARHPARHRSPINVPPSPSMLALLNLLAVQRKHCSLTEPVRLAVGTARARTP